jgi:hypothetical protein
MCTMSKKADAETTATVRLPKDLIDEARAVSEASASHPLGSRTYVEVIALAVKAGLPSVRRAVKATVAK